MTAIERQRHAARRRASARALALGWAAASALAIASCVGGESEERAARQGWWYERGPVVAHDDFPADCTLCHVGEDWTTIREDFVYDHEAETGVALRGAHAEAECLRCHNDRGPAGSFAAEGCAGCHVDPHERRLGRECELCHGESSWHAEGAVAEHGRTRFALLGAHSAVACEACHPGARVGEYGGLSLECVGCHAADLAAARSPDHLAEGWVDDCEDCHGTRGWGPEAFVHPAFALTGAHGATTCVSCHSGGGFAGLTQDCFACHADDYDGALEPDHVALAIATDCELCHDTLRWEGAPFVHTGIFDECARCHEADWWAATEPNHAAANFTKICEDCHGVHSWRFGFEHAEQADGCDQCHLPEYARTSDPAHAPRGYSTRCEECHGLRDWRGVQYAHEPGEAECLPCHGPDYFAATRPPHVEFRYPEDCTACHETSSWRVRHVDHDRLHSLCVSCHLADALRAKRPDHVGFGFGEECALCHSTRDWRGTHFEHGFPVDVPPHNFGCTDCHVKQDGFATFSCTHCHAHNQNLMKSVHKRVRDYVWHSQQCYECHPNAEPR